MTHPLEAIATTSVPRVEIIGRLLACCPEGLTFLEPPWDSSDVIRATSRGLTVEEAWEMGYTLGRGDDWAGDIAGDPWRLHHVRPGDVYRARWTQRDRNGGMTGAISADRAVAHLNDCLEKGDTDLELLVEIDGALVTIWTGGAWD